MERRLADGSEGGLCHEVEPSRQAAGDVGCQLVLRQGCVDGGEDLLQSRRCGLQHHASPGDRHKHALDDVLGRRLLCLRRFRLQAELVQELGHPLEGAGRQLIQVDAVEVVDVVAGDDPEQHPLQRLQRVGGAVKVPDRRRRAKTHRHVKPHGDPVGRRQEGAGVRRLLDRPLPVGVEEVVAEDAQRLRLCRADQLDDPADNVDVVVDKVVRRHIVCLDRGVVAGPAPVFASSNLGGAVSRPPG